MLVCGLRAHLDRKQQIRGADRCNVLKTWICPRKAGIQLISLGPRFLLLSMLWLRAAETLFQSRHLREDVSAKFSGLAFSPPFGYLKLGFAMHLGCVLFQSEQLSSHTACRWSLFVCSSFSTYLRPWWLFCKYAEYTQLQLKSEGNALGIKSAKSPLRC